MTDSRDFFRRGTKRHRRDVRGPLKSSDPNRFVSPLDRRWEYTPGTLVCENPAPRATYVCAMACQNLAPPPLLLSTLGRSWANHELLQQGYSAGTGRHRHPPVPVLLREEQKRVARRRGRLVVGRRVRLGRVRAGRALRIRGGRCGGRRRRRVVADGLRHLGQPVRGPLEAALRRPLVPARTSTGISDPSVEAETRTIGCRAAPRHRTAASYAVSSGGGASSSVS